MATSTTTRTSLTIGGSFLVGVLVATMFFPSERRDLMRTIRELRDENAALRQKVEVLERQAAEDGSVLDPGQQQEP